MYEAITLPFYTIFHCPLINVLWWYQLIPYIIAVWVF
ncbi:hypothetical protein F0726_00016 [Acidithiobacillus caldus]|nr:hypothetical protein F0726_00016 [Acidithiobacillus caldus]